MRPEISEALRLAAKLLARRDLSVAMLGSRLEEAGYSEADAHEAVEWLVQNRYLDDLGVARRETEKAVHNRGWGRVRVEARLQSLAVSSEAATAALEHLDEETEKSLAGIALARRFKGVVDPGKAARFLAGRGFSEDAVRAALDSCAPGWEDAT